MKKAEKFFSAFLFIMEEWSLFPQIAYSHSRGGLGEIISPSRRRHSPFYSAWAVRLRMSSCTSRLSSTK